MKNDALLTTAGRVELLVNGLNSGIDHRPVVKLFMPDGAATWLLTECDPDDPDRLFGLCDLGLGCPELGYVSLTEIMEVRGRLGLPVERDLHFVADKPLSAYADEAQMAASSPDKAQSTHRCNDSSDSPISCMCA